MWSFLFFLFFFSSRRRHTRLQGDWSSDVCSSDLLTLEAARAFPGPKWLVTGASGGPIAELAEEVVVCTPELERSWCHTASYTCAVAAIAALRGEDIAGLPTAVETALRFEEP